MVTSCSFIVVFTTYSTAYYSYYYMLILVSTYATYFSLNARNKHYFNNLRQMHTSVKKTGPIKPHSRQLRVG